MEFYWTWFTGDGEAWLCEKEVAELSVARDGLAWRWRMNGETGKKVGLHNALRTAEQNYISVFGPTQ